MLQREKRHKKFILEYFSLETYVSCNTILECIKLSCCKIFHFTYCSNSALLEKWIVYWRARIILLIAVKQSSHRINLCDSASRIKGASLGISIAVLVFWVAIGTGWVIVTIRGRIAYKAWKWGCAWCLFARSGWARPTLYAYI